MTADISLNMTLFGTLKQAAQGLATALGEGYLMHRFLECGMRGHNLWCMANYGGAAAAYTETAEVLRTLAAASTSTTIKDLCETGRAAAEELAALCREDDQLYPWEGHSDSVVD